METSLGGMQNAYNEGDDDYAFVITVPKLGRLAVTTFSGSFWMQLSAVMLAQSILNVTIACIVYEGIIVQRRKQRQQQGGSSAAALLPYLLGYGVICPLLLCVPFVVNDFSGLQNMAVKLCAAAAPCILLFRCVEAMHGTAPRLALDGGLGRFVLYYASVLQFNFDPKTGKPVPLRFAEVRRKVIRMAIVFVETSILFTVLIARDYAPFPRREIRGLVDVLHWGHIGNNYLLALLSSWSLEVGSISISLATSLVTGISTVDLNFNPLSASNSPSEFWGQRWNRLTSGSLKRAVAKPLLINGHSRPVAVMATFFASGLLHEYILLVMCTPRDGPGAILSRYGYQTAFFLWNGMVIILEQVFKENPMITWIRKNAPQAVRTGLVLLTVLPIAHWFCDEYIRVGFEEDMSKGFPRVHWLGLGAS